MLDKFLCTEKFRTDRNILTINHECGAPWLKITNPGRRCSHLTVTAPCGKVLFTGVMNEVAGPSY